MPRRFHTKSRFGCTVCKKRRVKCDERQPTCGGCAKIRVKCNYSNPDMSPATSSEGSKAEESVSHVSEDNTASQSQTTFDLLDLTLMHYYSTHTCQHLFTGEKQTQVWQHYIPTLHVSNGNGMLMHGLLAITALHQARQNPQKRDLYQTRALQHHGVGLPLFKAMIASASFETAEIIVVYAILLSIWVYASHDMTTEQLSLDDVLSTVEIARTGRSVFHIYKDVVITTPISIFLVPPRREPLVGSQVHSAHEVLERLQSQINDISDKEAVSLLQELMDRYLAGVDHTRSAAGWMASVNEEYWARLRSHCPEALLVFAYGCLLAYASEHECWWLAGWPDRILLACDGILTTAEKEVIGWEGHEQRIRTLGSELSHLAQWRNENS